MHCHLLISSLFPPATQTQENDPLFGIKVPALQTMLARGRSEYGTATDLESWLSETFGVPRGQDYPSASLRLLGDGIVPGEAFWLCADPVHLAVERDQLVLSRISLRQDDADALVATLNQHFDSDGLHFVAPTAERWYLRLERAPSIATHGLHQVEGKNIHPFLPIGPDALRWRALLNEIQMLLFEHPVNTAREARREPAINSIWPWGGGVLPKTLNRPFDQVWADDILALGVARAADIPGETLPRDIARWLERLSAGKHLVVLDALGALARQGDQLAWRAHLTRLEQTWFAPLKQALQRGKIQLTLHAPDAAGTLSFTPSRASLWRIWLPARDLVHYRRQEN